MRVKQLNCVFCGERILRLAESVQNEVEKRFVEVAALIDEVRLIGSPGNLGQAAGIRLQDSVQGRCAHRRARELQPLGDVLLESGSDVAHDRDRPLELCLSVIAPKNRGLPGVQAQSSTSKQSNELGQC